MATKKPSNSPTEWDNPNTVDAQEWESASSGFAPLWRPQMGESIIVQVLGVEPFKLKEKKVKKGEKKEVKKQPSFAISCILRGGSLANFFKNKTTHADVTLGDNVTVGSSYNLCGEDRLIVVDGKEARLSKMSELLAKDNQAFRIVYNGQVQTDGPNKVNDFTVQFPKGYKEKLSQK